MSRWNLVENLPDTTRYYPDGPEGPYITMRGECVPAEGTYRYRETERDICGQEITVVVQLTITPFTNGIRVWYPSDNGTWYWQTSHFKNTLLNDPEFEALFEQERIKAGVPLPPRD